MKYIFIFWAIPMGFIWGWYFLSANDITMGTVYLSRPFHDLVFAIYGQVLGMDAAAIPALLAKACIFDTLLILCLFALRKRREIAAWWRGSAAQPVPAASLDNMESLSKAP